MGEDTVQLLKLGTCITLMKKKRIAKTNNSRYSLHLKGGRGELFAFPIVFENPIIKVYSATICVIKSKQHKIYTLK